MTSAGEPDRWRYLPARDLGMRGLDRLSSTRRESGVLGAFAADGCARAMSAYMRLYHRLGVEGIGHSRVGPPAVIVANHASHLDAPSIIAALSCRQRRGTYVVAAADTFFKTRSRAGPAAGMLNALALRRGRGGRHELAHLRERLIGEPCRLIVFPEGTRSRSGGLGAFREGVGMLVAGTEVPVVPCGLRGAHAAMPPGARLPRPRSIRCHFGAPVRFHDTPDTRDGWAQIAGILHASVRGLCSEALGPADDAEQRGRGSDSPRDATDQETAERSPS